MSAPEDTPEGAVPKPNRDDPMIAAEWALGLLEGEELLAARGKYATDPDFAWRKEWWDDWLAPMTDAMAGAGAPPGRYTIGPHEIDVGADGVARQPGGQGFAGSTLTPDVGVANVAAWLGIAPAAARELWSTAPATAFGVTLPPL